jgi:hypothetical protein
MDAEATTSVITVDGEIIGETTEVSLKIYEPERHSYELYEHMGRALGNYNRRMQWVVGDWINLVEDIYPDRYSQAVEATGLSRQTLMNRASICRRIPENRRRAGVPFSVHAEVAYLEPRERESWLDQATKNGWERDELRARRRAAKEVGVGQDAVTSSAETAGELVRPLHTCPECGHSWRDEE